MGFPVCYSELLLPRVLIQFLSLLALLRRLLSFLLCLAGLPDLLENSSPSSSPDYYTPASSWPEGLYFTPSSSASSALLREVLPVLRLSEIQSPPESCAVCLYDFEPHDEARRLPSCCHVFHRGCIDRWLGYGHHTCPLCRTSLVPDEVADAVNQGLWAASGFSDFEGDFSQYDLHHFSSPLLIEDSF
ncbi:hypothetical protein SAY87_015224 [Trapa incisa]|uniref:RING-type domain-containing protein n=1 Tax=Trapa incisa TaxID=236973 RepID=A0AAN7GWU7_9MYRT|nr:hypothetical protein SAY87_015224 [Trapa incisa]